MAQETIWCSSDGPYRPLPHDWTLIHKPNTGSFLEYLAMKEWCLDEENPGEFGTIPSRSFPSAGYSDGSLWAFSDMGVAMEFKMRFA